MQLILRCEFVVGNDLARVLRWGPGYNGQEHPVNLLRDLIEADEIKLDRYVKKRGYRPCSHVAFFSLLFNNGCYCLVLFQWITERMSPSSILSIIQPVAIDTMLKKITGWKCYM